MDIEENIDTELTGVQSKAGLRVPPTNATAAGGAIGGATSTTGSTTSVIISAVTNAGAAVLPPVAGAAYAAGTAAYQNRPNGIQGAVCSAVGAAAGVGTGAAITVAASGAGPVGTAAGIVVGNVAGNVVSGTVTNACNAAGNYLRKDCSGLKVDIDKCSYSDLTEAIAQCEELPAETMSNLGDPKFRNNLKTGLENLHDKKIIDATEPLAYLGAFEERFANITQNQEATPRTPAYQAKPMSMS